MNGFVYMTDKLTRFIHDHKPIAAVAVVYAVMFVLAGVNSIVAYESLANINLHGIVGVLANAVCVACYLTLPLLILGRWSLVAYCVSLPVIVFLDAVLLFVYLQFHFQLDGSWLGIVLASDPREVRWFISEYLFYAIGGGVVVSLVCWILSKLLECASEMSARARLILLAGMVACITIVHCVVGFSWDNQCAVYLVKDSFKAFDGQRRLANLKRNPELPADLHLLDDSVTNVLGVLVVGESSTRNHWHLYGYPRNTTEGMDALGDEIFVFENLKAAASYTSKALTYLLTAATVETEVQYQFTLPQAMTAVGFDVRLLSNQRRWGRWDGTTQYAFAGCREMRFLADDSSLNQSHYDMELVDLLKQSLTSSVGCNVRIMHLMGSHDPAAFYYPPDEAVFPVPKIEPGLNSRMKEDAQLRINHYDNSIAYTDKVLARVVDLLKQHNGPSFMIYVSDHGESPDQPKWRVATDPSVWEIPMIVWVSEDYRKCFPDVCEKLGRARKSRLQSDQLLYGLLHIAGISAGGGATTFCRLI